MQLVKKKLNKEIIYARVKGIEPLTTIRQIVVLPLDYTPLKVRYPIIMFFFYNCFTFIILIKVIFKWLH